MRRISSDRPQLGHAIVELVLVGEAVDEAGSQRVFRQERPLIDQRAHVRLGLLAALGDAAHELRRTCRG